MALLPPHTLTLPIVLNSWGIRMRNCGMAVLVTGIAGGLRSCNTNPVVLLGCMPNCMARAGISLGTLAPLYGSANTSPLRCSNAMPHCATATSWTPLILGKLRQGQPVVALSMLVAGAVGVKSATGLPHTIKSPLLRTAPYMLPRAKIAVTSLVTRVGIAGPPHW